MIRIKNILCPIDYSVYSEIALKYAIEFAGRYHANLFLLHVLDIRVYDMNEPEIFSPKIVDEESIDSLKAKLLKSVSEEVKGGITVEAIVQQGVPFSEIIKVSNKYGIDLIVIGTHGRTGLAHAIMGSVAEKVVRKAACPVMTVRHPEREFVTPEESNGKMRKYTLVDHTADIGIDVSGTSLLELFSNAGFALFDILTDLSEVEIKLTREVDVTGIDKEQLLVNWLSELLYLHEMENVLFKEFDIVSLKDDQLHASVRGEVFIEKKHVIKTGIKAVTHHNLLILKEGGLWKARVIFDV